MFKHFIFTRWNLLDDKTTIYNNPAITNPEGWMDHRIKLFEKYCLPNVMLQKGDFIWLLSFAPGTPKWITDKYASFPHIKIIYEYPKTWLRKQPLKDGEWIITSRLDNDDTIYPDYIERVQEQFNEKFLLVDTDGLQRDLLTDKYYTRYIKIPGGEIDLKTARFYTVERKTCNSPFISLIEQVGTDWMSISHDPKEKRLITDRIKTCYWCSHGKMEWHFPAVKINEVLYVMNIHSKNVINKIIGNEVL